MRLVYPYLVLSVLLACEGGSGQPTTDTSDTAEDTASADPPGTTGAAEQPTSTTTDAGEPNRDETTTDDSSTTVFTGTESADTDEPVDTSTTLFTGTTHDTDGTDSTDPPETSVGPESDTEGGGGNAQPCVGPASPIGAEVIAYLESQIVDGQGDEPDLLHVRFSNQSFTCADPHDHLACGHNWEVALQIPVAYQVPGVYGLADGQIHAIGVSNGGKQGDDVCEEAGGAASGTLEIDAIDGDSITGRLCHLRAIGVDGPITLDGTFVAPRCPQ